LFENEWNHGIDMLDHALTLAGEEAELLSAELKNNNFAYLALKIMTEIPETAKNVRDFFKFLHYLNNHDFPSINGTNDKDNYFDFEDILDLMRLWFATGTDAYRQHPGEDVSQNWLLQGLSLITGDNLKPTIKALREAEKKGIPLTASPHFFACVATLPDALKSWLAVINVIFKYKHFTPAQEMVLFDFSSLRLVGEDRQEAILKAYVLSYYPTLVTLKERGLWTEDFTSFHNPNFPSMIKYMSLFPEENATDAATELAYISNACHAYNLKPLFKTLKKMPTPERLKALTRAFITAQEKPVKFMIHFYAQIYFSDFPNLKKNIIDQMAKPEIATVENIQKGLLETFFAIATAEEKQAVLNSWRRRIHDHSLVEGIFLHPDLFKKHDERLYSLAQYAEKLRLTDLIHTSTLEKRMKIARRVMEHPEKWAMTKQDDPLFIAAIHCTLPAFCQ
nr:hypothetical protein [Alphaproteobacteria bacterium]